MASQVQMNEILTELGQEFTELRVGDDIYLAPLLIVPPVLAHNWAIQVAKEATTYTQHEGTARAEQFVIAIGLYMTFRYDSQRFHYALSQAVKDIYTTKERIVSALDGSFLNNSLTRPLIITSETGVTQKKDLLTKTIYFEGGMNDEWAR